MLSCASVDQRLTGTDSSMKLSRRSESMPVGRVCGGASAGRDLNPPSRRVRRLPSGLKGRSTTEGDVNLPLILSPFHRARNDFSYSLVRGQPRSGGLALSAAVGDPPDC